MMAPLAWWASQPHFADHLRPIHDAMDPNVRGKWWPAHRIPEPAALTVVASAGDAIRLGRRAVVLVEHGAGQAYPDAPNPSYSGGPKRDNVVLFLCPNEVSAGRNSAAYPHAAVKVVGSPRVDALLAMVAPDSASLGQAPAQSRMVLPSSHRRAAAEAEGAMIDRAESGNGSLPTVAITHHWDCVLVPETRWAQPHFIRAYPDLARRFHVIGHGHPRYRFALGAVWKRLGIEHVPDFADVVARARVLIADNTSAMYEWAALDRPVVVLNAPWYRRDIDAWPRFWACADVGIQVNEPEHLNAAVAVALDDPPHVAARRREVVDEVFPIRDGQAAQRSAHAIEAVLCRVPSAA